MYGSWLTVLSRSPLLNWRPSLNLLTQQPMYLGDVHQTRACDGLYHREPQSSCHAHHGPASASERSCSQYITSISSFSGDLARDIYIRQLGGYASHHPRGSDLSSESRTKLGLIVIQSDSSWTWSWLCTASTVGLHMSPIEPSISSRYKYDCAGPPAVVKPLG